MRIVICMCLSQPVNDLMLGQKRTYTKCTRRIMIELTVLRPVRSTVGINVPKVLRLRVRPERNI